jgi:hypothetical protein
MAVGIPTKELHQLGDINFVGVNLLQHVLHGFVLPGEQIVRCLVASSGAIVNFDVQGFAERVHRVEPLARGVDPPSQSPWHHFVEPAGVSDSAPNHQG